MGQMGHCASIGRCGRRLLGRGGSFKKGKEGCRLLASTGKAGASACCWTAFTVAADIARLGAGAQTFQTLSVRTVSYSGSEARQAWRETGWRWRVRNSELGCPGWQRSGLGVGHGVGHGTSFTKKGRQSMLQETLHERSSLI